MLIETKENEIVRNAVKQGEGNIFRVRLENACVCVRLCVVGFELVFLHD